MNDFYQAALHIARHKLFIDKQPGILNSPRLGTGGNFANIFLWDTVFSAHWAKYHANDFPLFQSLDNFYRCQDEDGFISREIQPNGISLWNKAHPISFAPPLLSWIELDLHNRGLHTHRLADTYPKLAKLHEFNRRWQRPDGLYFSDMLGCGMDDIPRYNTVSDLTPKGIQFTRDTVLLPGEKGDRLYDYFKHNPDINLDWNRQLAWVDTSCQVAFDASNLAAIAKIIGKPSEAAAYEEEFKLLKKLINEKLYDETHQFYCDRLDSGSFNSHLHIGGFWALISGVATPQRSQALCQHLTNPHTFGLPGGTPGLSFSDPSFSVNRYWCGPVWYPTQYMILCGLKRYHQDALARKLAERFYQTTLSIWKRTGTIWENYPPLQMETPSPCAARDFCGWSALAPIAIYREFLQ